MRSLLCYNRSTLDKAGQWRRDRRYPLQVQPLHRVFQAPALCVVAVVTFLACFAGFPIIENQLASLERVGHLD